METGTVIRVMVLNGPTTSLPTTITIKSFDMDDGTYQITGHDNRVYMFPTALTVIITEI